MGKYFTIEELCRSTTAAERGIDNTPTDEAVRNMETLIAKVLDPAREIFKRPIIVSSGYRSRALNDALAKNGHKVSKNSHHMTGQAADLMTGTGYGNKVLHGIISRCGIPFTQLINEHPDADGNPEWVHVSYVEGDLRRQELVERRRT